MKISKNTSSYDTLERFISYYYQIFLVKKFNPNKILEIGIENKTVSSYLINNGYDVETCDIRKDTNPDFVADIRNLPFKNRSYDLVLAFEVLEHLPWKDFEASLNELYRVSKKDVLISLPYSSIQFSAVIKFPFIRKIINKSFINLTFLTPFFHPNKPLSSDHYWEIGMKNYSFTKIRKYIMGSGFEIVEDFRIPINNYHHFFILRKNNL